MSRADALLGLTDKYEADAKASCDTYQAEAYASADAYQAKAHASVDEYKANVDGILEESQRKMQALIDKKRAASDEEIEGALTRLARREANARLAARMPWMACVIMSAVALAGWLR